MKCLRQPPPNGWQRCPAAGQRRKRAAPLVKSRTPVSGRGGAPSLEGSPEIRVRHHRGEGPNGAGRPRWSSTPSVAQAQEGAVTGRRARYRDLSVAQIAHKLGYVFKAPAHALCPHVHDELALAGQPGKKPEEMNWHPRSVQIVNWRGWRNTRPWRCRLAAKTRQHRGPCWQALAHLAMTSRQPGRLQNYISFMKPSANSRFRSLLFITHDVDLAVAYSNRCCWSTRADGLRRKSHEVLKDQETPDGIRWCPPRCCAPTWIFTRARAGS